MRAAIKDGLWGALDDKQSSLNGTLGDTRGRSKALRRHDSGVKLVDGELPLVLRVEGDLEDLGKRLSDLKKASYSTKLSKIN